MLPLVLLLLDVWPLRRFRRRSLLGQLPALLIALLAGYIAQTSQSTYFEDKQWDRYWSLLQTILIAVHALTFYVTRTHLPLGLFLEYLIIDEHDISLATPRFAVGLAFALLLLLLWGRALWRRDHALWVPATIFVLLLAPTLTPLKYQESIAADR